VKAGDLEKKLRWFDRGAAAFSLVFPNALDFLGTTASPHYVCPECAEPDATDRNYRVQLFPRTAVQRGELTAEHVPPKAFNGRELVLTCKPCNSRAGSQLESHARKRENPSDVLRGVATKPARVRVITDRYNFSADLKVEEGMLDLHAKIQKYGRLSKSQESGGQPTARRSQYSSAMIRTSLPGQTSRGLGTLTLLSSR
jgi:hypothetical protein